MDVALTHELNTKAQWSLCAGSAFFQDTACTSGPDKRALISLSDELQSDESLRAITSGEVNCLLETLRAVVRILEIEQRPQQQRAGTNDTLGMSKAS